MIIKNDEKVNGIVIFFSVMEVASALLDSGDVVRKDATIPEMDDLLNRFGCAK